MASVNAICGCSINLNAVGLGIGVDGGDAWLIGQILWDLPCWTGDAKVAEIPYSKD